MHMCVGGPSPGWWPQAGRWHAWPGVTPPPALIQALPALQDDYIKSWEDNQPGDEGTAGAALGWGPGGSVTASMEGGG